VPLLAVNSMASRSIQYLSSVPLDASLLIGTGCKVPLYFLVSMAPKSRAPGNEVQC